MSRPRRDVNIACLILLLAAPARAQETHLELRRAGHYARAYEALLGVIQDPGIRLTPDLRADQAELLFLLGRVDEAIEAQKSLIVRRPFPSTLLRLSEFYEYRGLLDDYAETLRRAASQARVLSRYGVGPEEWVAIGRVFEREGTDAKAVLAHLERLLDQDPDNIQGHLAVAELSARKRAWDLAARSYGRVLELDRQNQDAWAGLAETYHASGDGRAGAAIDTLLDRNPDHPRARLLSARRHLDLGDTRAADIDLDRILAVNPVHRGARALRVAGRFLDDDPAGMAATRTAALAFNPHDSGVDRIPGQIASRHYRFAEGAAFQRRALESDENDLEARFALALDLLRLGRDAEARSHLERVFEIDPYHVQAYNLLEVADVIDTFERLEDERLSLQLPELDARVLGPDLRALLEEACDRYESRYRVTLDRPVTLQLFENHDEFMVRSVGLPGNAGHLGICFGRLITMDSPRARPAGASNWQRVLWHEFVHVVTLQKTGNRMPRWLSEGISVYEETQRDAAWGQERVPAFRPFVSDGSLPGLRDLEVIFTQARSGAELLFGYFAAGELVAFYVDTCGFDALLSALDAIRTGTPAEEALLEEAAISGDTFDLRFRNYLTERCAPLLNLPAPADHASMEGSSGDTAGSPFVEAMRRAERAAKDGDVDLAAAEYRRAYTLYPDATGEDAPLHRLADLYARHGDARHADVLVEIVGRNATAHREAMTLADLRAESGDWEGARNALNRAYAIIPFSPELLRERTEASRNLGDLEKAAADLRRLLAADPARAPEHRLDLARILRAQDDLDGARAEILTLLEATPYDWDAQQFLLEMVDAEAAGR